MTQKANTMKHRVLNFLTIVASIVLIVSCASTPPETPPPSEPKFNAFSRSEVLEEVKEDPNALNAVEATQDPTYTKLMQLLTSLGYEGVGLQFEPKERLEFLIQLFSHPKAANRDLRLVYTGLQMFYDFKRQSLTVGGLTDINKVVAFIEKNIKLKKPADRKPIVKTPVKKVSPTHVPPVAPVFPKKIPDDVSQKLQKQIPEPAATPEDAKPTLLESNDAEPESALPFQGESQTQSPSSPNSSTPIEE